VPPERRLGRGLGALLPGDEERRRQTVVEVELDAISPNPYQPREGIDPAGLEGLVESIQQNGILQPVTVRPTDGGYELVAGERRVRAARQLGMATIPAIVRELSDEKMLELALVENIQREDLNPIEKAKAYQELINTFGMTQEEAARGVGQDRSTVANFIRLLELPEEVQDCVSRGTISMGHARALLALSTPKRQIQLCRMIVKQDLSVRETERLTGGRPKPARRKAKGTPTDKKASPHIRDLEDQLRLRLGTRVKITAGKDRGKIVIEFFGNDEFERILGLLGARLE